MTQYSDYFGPEGLRVRGTVLVVPGRGETRSTYTRFGRRLAADAYRVRVIDAPDLDTEDLTALAARLSEAAEDTAADDGVVRPLVLVGADSGAAAVAALLDRAPGVRPDAVVLAGLPGRSPAPPRPPAPGTRNSTSAPRAPPTGVPSPRTPRYGAVRSTRRCRRPCSAPPTTARPPYPPCCWSVTPIRSPITRRSRRPPSPVPAPGFRSCTGLITMCSTTSSTVRWPPRSSRSWRPCATICGRWSRCGRAPGERPAARPVRRLNPDHGRSVMASILSVSGSPSPPHAPPASCVTWTTGSASRAMT